MSKEKIIKRAINIFKRDPQNIDKDVKWEEVSVFSGGLGHLITQLEQSIKDKNWSETIHSLNDLFFAISNISDRLGLKKVKKHIEEAMASLKEFIKNKSTLVLKFPKNGDIIEKVKSKLAKGEDVKYKRHSTQIDIDDPQAFDQAKRKIPADCIYRELPLVNGQDDPKEEYGYERQSHVTVLYGVNKEEDYFKIREMLKDFGSIDIMIGNISSFRTADKPYDVLKLEIISPKLHKLHNMLKSNFDNEYKFPEYKPHLTLAYVKKDTCKDLEGVCSWTGKKYNSNKILFSHNNGYYLDIPLGD